MLSSKNKISFRLIVQVSNAKPEKYCKWNNCKCGQCLVGASPLNCAHLTLVKVEVLRQGFIIRCGRLGSRRPWNIRLIRCPFSFIAHSSMNKRFDISGISSLGSSSILPEHVWGCWLAKSTSSTRAVVVGPDSLIGQRKLFQSSTGSFVPNLFIKIGLRFLSQLLPFLYCDLITDSK